MAIRSDTLGPLLQGVSQQPDRVRLPGQVTSQTNLISDVTLGLSTRPSTTSGSDLSNGTSTHSYQDITFNGVDYVIGYKSGSLEMWNLSGVRQNIQYRNGGTPNYIGANMQFHVVDDKIVLVNRDTNVRQDATVASTDWYVSLFHALGGAFSKTYEVIVKFSDGSTIDGTYTAPDGTTQGDAANTSSEYIVEQLVTDLLADTNLPVGTLITREFDVASVYHPTLSMTITVSDGQGGEVLRAVSSTVEDVEDLPRFAPNGMLVEILSSDAEEDNYWLKFNAAETIPEDGTSGFGNEGVWEESFDPSEPTAYDLSTMPHVLVLESGTFYMEQAEWLSRSVGDAESAPFASILDKPIRDLMGFESRLVLLTPDTVVMSRTKEPFDLWRETATTVSPSDPIDLTSTKKDDLSLDWLIPFDRDLFIMSDPGDSQFVIRGGGIDSENASMVLTTEFEISSSGAKPRSTGRTILLPFKKGQYSGLKEFYTDSDSAANAANSLTETQDRYIPGLLTRMAVSQNFNTVLALTDTEKNNVWVYKYLWDGDQILQSSWSNWTFVDEVHHIFFRNSIVYVVGVTSEGVVFLHSLNLDRPIGEFGYHEMLDRKQELVRGAYISLPYPNARFLQSTGCANPGLEATPTLTIQVTSSDFRYFFDDDVVPSTATLRCGQTVPWELTPTEVFVKNFQGDIDTSKELTIQEYVVQVDNSGEFKAVGTSPFADTWEYAEYRYPLDNEPLDPDLLLLQTGEVVIPWGEVSSYASMSLQGTDVRPVTIQEIRWAGQILKKRGRR